LAAGEKIEKERKKRWSLWSGPVYRFKDGSKGRAMLIQVCTEFVTHGRVAGSAMAYLERGASRLGCSPMIGGLEPTRELPVLVGALRNLWPRFCSDLSSA
jgi:hypothetical protein